MKVEKFTTFYKISEYNPNDKRIDNIKKLLTTKDYKTEQDIPLGWFGREDVLHIPAGVGDEFIKRFTYIYDIIDRRENFMEHNINFKMKNSPYDKQQEVIDFVMDNFKTKHQITIDLFTGTGKTYTSIDICNRLKKRAVIFVKTTYLKEQWVKALCEHTDLKDNIFYSEGPDSILEAAENESGYDFFVLTHKSVFIFLKEYGYKKFNEFLLRNKIGVKIFDEYDTEVRNMLRVDCHSNIKYTMYLSATTFKSSFKDDMIFQRCFHDVPIFGKCVFANYIPQRDCEVILYESEPVGKEWIKCFNYDDTFNQAKYHKFLFTNYRFIKPLEIPMVRVKEEMKDKKFKCVIFVALIDACEIVKETLVEHFKINSREIGIYNSSVPNKLKKQELDKQIVISTSMSFSRGVDVKGLIGLINLEYFSSLSTFIQMAGRVGRYGGQEGWMYDCIDTSFYTCENAYTKRKGTYSKEFRSVKVTSIIKPKKGDGKSENVHIH